MDVSLIRSIANNLLTRYGDDASQIAAHAAWQTQRDGDVQATKQCHSVRETIENAGQPRAVAAGVDILA